MEQIVYGEPKPTAMDSQQALDSGADENSTDTSAQSCGFIVNELLCSLTYFIDNPVDRQLLERCFMNHFTEVEVNQAHLLLNSLKGMQNIDGMEPAADDSLTILATQQEPETTEQVIARQLHALTEPGVYEHKPEAMFVDETDVPEVKPEVLMLAATPLSRLASRLRALTSDERFKCTFVAQDMSRVVTPSDLLQEEGDDPARRVRKRPRPKQPVVRKPRTPRKPPSPRKDPEIVVPEPVNEKRVSKLSAKAQDYKDTLDMLASVKQEMGEMDVKAIVTEEEEAKPAKRKRRPRQPRNKSMIADDGTVFQSIDELGKIPKEIREGSYNEATGQYHCRQCNKGFDAVQTLKRHWGAHEARKKNVCAECGKTFTSSSGLRDHMMIHSGQKPHQCDICGAFFRRICSVQRHRLTHENARPYMCHVCGKCFSASSVLAIHRRTHTGETPYSCRFCGQTFVRRTALKNHEHIHTGERPYKCKVCGKSYGNAGTYWHHQQLHKKEQAQQQQVFGNQQLVMPKSEELSPRSSAVLMASNRRMQFDAVVAAAEVLVGEHLQPGMILESASAGEQIHVQDGGEVQLVYETVSSEQGAHAIVQIGEDGQQVTEQHVQHTNHTQQHPEHVAHAQNVEHDETVESVIEPVEHVVA